MFVEEIIALPPSRSSQGGKLRGLRSHLERVRRMLTAPKGRMQATLQEHEAVTAAILRGDAAGARAAMDRHLNAMSETVETFAREKPDLFLP